jgi:hypothetical protein
MVYMPDAAATGKATTNMRVESQPLGAPRDAQVAIEKRDDKQVARLTWQTAYAGDQPLSHYEILRGGEKVGQVEHKPQLTKEPFAYEESAVAGAAYKVVAVDAEGRRAEAEAV